jgi:hypothetical protein
VIALALLLLQAASPTPTPTPTPAVTATPVVSTARTLSDIARERRIAKEKAGAAGKPAKGGTLSVAPKTEGGDANAPPTPAPVDDAAGEDRKARIVVDSAEHNGVVQSGGQVQVYGKLRNNGSGPACDISLTVRIYDDKGIYLASAVTKADEGVVRPNSVASFNAWLQAPPGVAGAIRDKGLGYGTTGAGATLEGKWRMLGDRVDVEVTTYSEKCVPVKDEAKAPPN